MDARHSVKNWPWEELVQEVVDSICNYVVSILKSDDTVVVFDSYFHYRIDSSARLGRNQGIFSRHLLTLSSLLPPKSVLQENSDKNYYAS